MKLPRIVVSMVMVAVGLVAGVGHTSSPVAAAPAIQPGARIKSETATCTMNFIYRDVIRERGKSASVRQDPRSRPSLYAGTAAHCVSKVGERVALCDPTYFDGPCDVSFGAVAFRFLRGFEDDVAFIEIDRDKEDLVNPTMLGFKGPTGVISGSDARRGEIVHLYGHGLVFGETEPTRPRSGTLSRSDSENYAAMVPTMFGDSGGPILHESGAALGIVANLAVPTDLETMVDGNTVEWALTLAAAAGLHLEIVPG